MTDLYTEMTVVGSTLCQCPDDGDGAYWEARFGTGGVVEIWRRWPNGSASWVYEMDPSEQGDIEVTGTRAPFEHEREWWTTLNPDVQNSIARDPHGPIPKDSREATRAYAITATWSGATYMATEDNLFLKGSVAAFIESENARLIAFLTQMAPHYTRAIEVTETSLPDRDTSEDPNITLITDHLGLAKARGLDLPPAYV